ncbi:MAG: hypothetical protein ABIP39_03480 [Polyangiaceae bacterium]
MLVPQPVCARESEGWYRGDLEQESALARGVERWVDGDLAQSKFKTGSPRIDGEWLFATYMMAGMGFGQMALEHPELREESSRRMVHCIEKLIEPKARVFERAAWSGTDPLTTLNGADDHGAYLGYLNLVLSMHRLIEPNSKFAPLNDAITATLVRRLRASRLLLLQSYPGEVYPVDNTAAIGSIGLYDRATGADHHALLEAVSARFRRDYIDKSTGLLIQLVDPSTGARLDAPRGSGTCLAIYFLSFADRSLSRELWTSARRELESSVLRFGVLREYPSGYSGRGDYDSGPVVFGYGFTASGFAIGASRVNADEASFRALYSTAHLFGLPHDEANVRRYATGGPIGDAILFAMVTAPKEAQR